MIDTEADWVRRVPRPIRDAAKGSVELFGQLTGPARVLPGLVLIGGQRCGTSSLHAMLLRHPAVGASFIKEVQYFSLHFDKSERWYRGHFPTKTAAQWSRRRHGLPLVAAESSPYYIFHPHAPRRLASLLPEARLVVLLRDPVERALSHYGHERRLGFETLPLEEALSAERRRLAGEVQRMQREPSYRSVAHQHFSYVARGMYAEQLERWFEFVPRERFLILSSEELFAEPERVVARVLTFAGLPQRSLGAYPRHNRTGGSGREVGDTRRRLRETFAEPNQRLVELLGHDLPWCCRAAA